MSIDEPASSNADAGPRALNAGPGCLTRHGSCEGSSPGEAVQDVGDLL